MSPSFRDLKGRPVEEVVTSRVGPSEPEPGPAMVERAAVRAAVEKVQARKGEPEPTIFPGRMVESDRLILAEPEPTGLVAPIPEDVEVTLDELDTAMAVVLDSAQHLMDAVRTLREQVTAVRFRTAKDAGKLAKVMAVLKAFEQG